MKAVVLAIFADSDKVQTAMENLVDRSITQDQIGVLTSERTEFSGIELRESSRSGEGAAIGAGAGGAVGAILAGMTSVGAIASGPIGFMATGPIIAAFAGAGAGAAGGGVVGMLVGMGIPEQEAKKFEEEVESGAIIVTVETDDTNVENVRSVLDGAGARRVMTV